MGIISKWESWDNQVWGIRNNICDWLLDRTDNQICDGTATMMDNVDRMVGDMEVKEVDTETIKMGTAELFIEILESGGRSEFEVCDGQFVKARHECDNTSFELSEDGELECLNIDDNNPEVEEEISQKETATRQEKLDKIRQERRTKMMTRKKAEQRPVEGEIRVEKVRRAETLRGQRLIESMETDKKLIQDKSARMVMVGADVEALYPSLADIQVANIIYKAIIETEVGFEGIDYMEGCKYIVMNSTAQECRASPLRRILPIRRHTNGVRPGVTGADPMGPESGGQDQWKFRPGIKITPVEKRMIVATVMKIAVLVLFRTHIYEFGGHFYLQKKGGPIGLRSTCALARIIMLWWDEELMSLISSNNLTVEEKARYMDDIRLWLYSIRLGWRWQEGRLQFCSDWRKEEREAGMTGLQKTMEIMKEMMNSICDWLNFTMESVDDFGGKLPTLDLNIWIMEDNMIVYIFYQKPMASSMVIQRRSAMPENMRVSTLNQEMIRRMLNTSERLGIEWRLTIVDDYAQKLTNSGYDLAYTRKIIIGGLTGYERKLALSLDKDNPKWKPLHPGAKFDQAGRRKRKMMAKTNWFNKEKDKEEPKLESPSKKRRINPEAGMGGGCVTTQTGSESNIVQEDANMGGGCVNAQTGSSSNIVQEEASMGGGCVNAQTGSSSNIVQDEASMGGRTGSNIKRGKRSKPSKPTVQEGKKQKSIQDLETLAVLFVDQTHGGALQKTIQAAEDSIALMVGYRVRVVETSGTQLCRLLPYTNPWGGQHCGRPSCYTCGQGGERLQNCKQRNIMYESTCEVCNPEEEPKDDDKTKKLTKYEKFKEQTGVYVGETSRSIFERAEEHRRDAESRLEESHMFKHWQVSHKELPDAPKFRIKVVASFRDPLSRQLSEAVRIELRGDGVLNSKAEYSRSRIPRLKIDKDEWKAQEEKRNKVEATKEKNSSEQAEQDERALLEGGGSLGHQLQRWEEYEEEKEQRRRK